MNPADLAAWVGERRAGSDRFLLGICGPPPGSGKSTIASELGAEVGAPVVTMDGFHLPNSMLDERDLRAWKGAPRTFDAVAFVTAVRSIHADRGDVTVPEFDRIVDEPIPDAVRIASTERLVIVEGNYLLLPEAPWGQLIDLFDAVVYIDLDRASRIERLVARHVEFGKSVEDANEFVLTRDERNAESIEANRGRATVDVRRS